MPRVNLSNYQCKFCKGRNLEIDYEYHDGTTAGLRKEDLSIYCPDCGEADMFTVIAQRIDKSSESLGDQKK